MPPVRVVAAGALAALAVLALAPPLVADARAQSAVVQIAAPAGAATIGGATRFGVRYGRVRPRRVAFLVNGRPRHVDPRPPFVYKRGKIGVSELRPGWNRLTAAGRRGALRTSDSIRVFSAQGFPIRPVRWDGGPRY